MQGLLACSPPPLEKHQPRRFDPFFFFYLSSTMLYTGRPRTCGPSYVSLFRPASSLPRSGRDAQRDLSHFFLCVHGNSNRHTRCRLADRLSQAHMMEGTWDRPFATPLLEPWALNPLWVIARCGQFLLRLYHLATSNHSAQTPGYGVFGRWYFLVLVSIDLSLPCLSAIDSSSKLLPVAMNNSHNKKTTMLSIRQPRRGYHTLLL